MDRTELMEKLQPFIAKCAEKGKPLIGISLDEAYPGDSSTSFIVRVKADWFEDTTLYGAIDFLFDTLWETTEAETRRFVFYIKILKKGDRLHSLPENIQFDAAYWQ